MATPIPDNRVEFSLAEICHAVGGELAGAAPPGVRGVVTDSRREVAGALFVALRGPTFDGHDFLREVAARGARAVLVDREVALPGGVAVIRVRDTLQALGQLGRFHRQRWGGRVIAIGGSAGKTTTRAAISAALTHLLPGQVHYAPGNLNNRVGVPLLILSAEPEHRVLVLEVGTNETGEVAELAGQAQPDVAVLTLVGLEHSAGLGDLDAIEQEEGALFGAVPAGGIAVANGDDERAVRQLERSPARRRYRYGCTPGCDCRVVGRTALGQGTTRIDLERSRGASGRREQLSLETALVGYPGALAVAAAVTVADQILGEPVALECLRRAFLGQAVMEPGRLCPLELRDGTLVLDDTYNANPPSARSSLDTAAEIARQRSARLVLVLGEMRELGPYSRAEHVALGALAARSGAARLLAIGGDAVHLAESARREGLAAVFVPDCAAGLQELEEWLEPGDVVLVKASRGVHAETVVRGLIESKGTPR